MSKKIYILAIMLATSLTNTRQSLAADYDEEKVSIKNNSEIYLYLDWNDLDAYTAEKVVKLIEHNKGNKDDESLHLKTLTNIPLTRSITCGLIQGLTHTNIALAGQMLQELVSQEDDPCSWTYLAASIGSRYFDVHKDIDSAILWLQKAAQARSQKYPKGLWMSIIAQNWIGCVRQYILKETKNDDDTQSNVELAYNSDDQRASIYWLQKAKATLSFKQIDCLDNKYKRFDLQGNLKQEIKTILKWEKAGQYDC